MARSLADEVHAIVGDRLGPIEVRAAPVDHHERLVWMATGPTGPLAVKADVDPERHRRELLGLRAAHRAGCPVPDVIDRVGGPVNVLMLTVVTGVPLRSDDPPTAWALVGAGLQELHGVEPTGETCVGVGTGAAERVGGFLDYALGGESGLDDPLRASGVTFIEHALTSTVVGVQVHGDGQPDHFLLDADRARVTGVLDFGDSGLGDPLWDIAVLTLDHPEHADAVLRGYADPSVLDRAETELTGYWALRCLTEIRWLTEHDYDPTPTRARLQHLLTPPPTPG